jgi:hypothetical protein
LLKILPRRKERGSNQEAVKKYSNGWAGINALSPISVETLLLLAIHPDSGLRMVLPTQEAK